MNKIKSLSLAYCVFIGLIAAALFKLFVFEILTVDGSSMSPALKDNQTIYVNKLAYGIVNPFGSKLIVQWAKPKKDDIVVYLYNNNLVVKRLESQVVLNRKRNAHIGRLFYKFKVYFTSES